jgi:hypothetical protein
MSETEDRLYALIDVITQQQEAVQKALDGLAAERAALERERQALARGVEAMRQGAQSAVRLAVKDSLAEVSATITQQAEAATAPVLAKLAGVVDTAKQAEAVLRNAVQWASWRLLRWGIAGIAALGLLWWLVSAAVLWWDAGAIGRAQDKKVQLESDVAEMQANYDEWKKAGMLGKIIQCNPGNRPCIRVDEKAGLFGDDDRVYRVIYGY